MKSGFITLEGIDGCGKSSLTGELVKRLAAAGFSVELTLEPTRTWLGDAVRRSYTEEINPYTEAFLFLADRATHTDLIRKKMAEGKLVISDRYSDSTVAYQAALLQHKLGGDSRDYMKWLLEISQPVILKPDVTLLLDIDPEKSLARLGNRTELEKFENMENLRQVRQNYLDLAANSDVIHVIDASESKDVVLEAVIGVIGKNFDVKL
ncbi:MAG: dTMP kinase [Candidatus Thermoplasmatota archaeon]|nr:dTMP kinase [Euryarchaeota archaeon]MBU4031283.1 dTMP kinase [Candidatus Thermoplasmatota archaeon]MBU4071373.1 dTMP kinase [Candidatus Thermoplasmatota archaeon]MBU4144202.1 dTMP kinase [Candidatus Thermoplasmatota archaeon]MBU4591506.1 dTMP kinase [Candidatus Thermoplasmatota archaeon]